MESGVIDSVIEMQTPHREEDSPTEMVNTPVVSLPVQMELNQEETKVTISNFNAQVSSSINSHQKNNGNMEKQYTREKDVLLECEINCSKGGIEKSQSALDVKSLNVDEIDCEILQAIHQKFTQLKNRFNKQKLQLESNNSATARYLNYQMVVDALENLVKLNESMAKNNKMSLNSEEDFPRLTEAGSITKTNEQKRGEKRRQKQKMSDMQHKNMQQQITGTMRKLTINDHKDGVEAKNLKKVSSLKSQKSTGKNTQRIDSSSCSESPQLNNNMLGKECKTPTNGETNKTNAQRRRRNRYKFSCNDDSEADTLRGYINKIVSEHSENYPTLQNTEDYTLKGGAVNLEAYASRLAEIGFGRIVEGVIRINRKNNHQSFITMPVTNDVIERDAMVLTPVGRRYAIEGDTVLAFVLRVPFSCVKKKSSEEDYFNIENAYDDDEEYQIESSRLCESCPKGFVIRIVNKVDRRTIGLISFKNPIQLSNGKHYYKFKPNDMRLPIVHIEDVNCKSYIQNLEGRGLWGLLFVAKILDTDERGDCIGELVEHVGKIGDLNAELKAVLFKNHLENLSSYEDRFESLFASPDPPALWKKELEGREDLRTKCIFTIDPLTARDLDDAVSVDQIDGDTYEVGVHIADVSYYLKENSEVDNLVKDRSTSVYLANRVIHMLPQTLCMKCSLLPGVEKLAISCFWQMDKSARIIGEPRFARSVINSCAQLSYENVQKIIKYPKKNQGPKDFPSIYNGFTFGDMRNCILILNKLAVKLRADRFEKGALSIDNIKIRFNIDEDTGEPINYEVEERDEANFLIEEFMLLANQAAARLIYTKFPCLAILRCHAPPVSKIIKAFADDLRKHNIKFDIQSSKSIYQSLKRACEGAGENSKAMAVGLSQLLTKPMTRAVYFCSEGKTAKSDFWHFALNIPIYTHFTSPIRRYPDILVHRLLTAALNYSEPPERTPTELKEIVKICNTQKFNAKAASDDTNLVLFMRYVRERKSLILRAVIIEMFANTITVVTLATGHVIQMSLKAQKVIIKRSLPDSISINEPNSSLDPIELRIFSVVDVNIVVRDDKLCGYFVSPDRRQRQKNGEPKWDVANLAENKKEYFMEAGEAQIDNNRENKKKRYKRKKLASKK